MTTYEAWLKIRDILREAKKKISDVNWYFVLHPMRKSELSELSELEGINMDIIEPLDDMIMTALRHASIELNNAVNAVNEN